MLIEQLKTNSSINAFLCNDCRENNVGVEIDATIDPANLLIIKVDSFYNTVIHSNDRPKSPDCLIIQRCKDNSYNLYIVELKDIASSGGLIIDDIEDKFTTCLDDFMSVRFGDLFYNPDFNFQHIGLYVVADPYGFKTNPSKQDKMRGHKFDLLSAIRIPKFFGKNLYIDPKIPNPSIKNCSGS